jgi:hypothetical protein
LRGTRRRATKAVKRFGVALLSTSPDRDDTIMVIDPFVDR